MKKLLLLCAFLTTGFYSFSQVKISLKFSPSIAINRVSNVEDSLYTYKPNSIGLRFVAGPELNFFFGNNYAFTTGLWYAAKRAGLTSKRINPTAGTVNMEKELYNLQYLQVPAMLKLFTNEVGTDKRIYFNVGGTFDVLLSAKQRKIGLDPVIYKFAPVDGTILVGSGLELQMGENTYFLAGLSYNRGLINSQKLAYHVENAGTPSEYFNIAEFKLNNDFISLDLGIRF